jgi:hypothetical protein
MLLLLVVSAFVELALTYVLYPSTDNILRLYHLKSLHSSHEIAEMLNL